MSFLETPAPRHSRSAHNTNARPYFLSEAGRELRPLETVLSIATLGAFLWVVRFLLSKAIRSMRYASRNSASDTSAKIRKGSRVKVRGGFLPQKHPCGEPV